MNTLLIEPATSLAPDTLPNTTPPRDKSTVEPLAHILYVDDDPSLRRLGELVLVKSGYSVDTAGDGEQAWDALHNQEYQLLITDNQMPCLTGEELIRKVRLAHMSVPIILASGLLATRPINDLPRAECSAMLAKPFSPEQLVSVVREVLQSAIGTWPSSGVRQPSID